MQVIDDCSGQHLLPFVTSNVAPGSNITTDGWKGYNGLEQAGYPHRKVLTSKVDDKDSVLPGVHLVVSLMKRVIPGIFQGRFDRAYLQRYLDEYVFRFNRRTSKSAGKRFWRIMQRAVNSPPVSVFRSQVALGVNLSRVDIPKILFS